MKLMIHESIKRNQGYLDILFTHEVLGRGHVTPTQTNQSQHQHAYYEDHPVRAPNYDCAVEEIMIAPPCPVDLDARGGTANPTQAAPRG